MPMIQVAGFRGKLSVISLPKKKEYKLEDVCSFCFPKSLNQIRTGSLENLVNFLCTIDDMLDNLCKIYHVHSSSDENDIESILTEVNQKKRLSYNAWLPKATFEIESDDDEDDVDEDNDDKDNDDKDNDDKDNDDKDNDDKDDDDEEYDDDNED